PSRRAADRRRLSRSVCSSRRGGGDDSRRGGGKSSAIHSVAALPFETVGGDTSTLYFADGMRDELATALGKVPSLSVASRTSSYAFRGKPGVTPRDIGRELGVDAILEGTVRRSGDQLRIAAQLTRASTGLGLWSESFDRRMTDVFALQEELARAIAAALGSAVRGGSGTVPGVQTISVAKSRGTSSQPAYDLYLRGRYLLNRRQLTPALRNFDDAVKLDSSFAQALAGASTAATLLPFYEGVPASDALARARVYADRALALDSTLSEPHTALGFGFAQTFAFDEGEREFKRAIALDSTSAIAYHLFGFMVAGIGRIAEALPLAEKAARLDPLSGPITQAQSAALIFAKRWDDAFAAGQRLLPIDSAYANRIIGNVYAGQGKWAEALAHFRVTPDDRTMWRDLPAVFVHLGQRREADSVRAVLEASTKHGGRYTDVAIAYAALGDTAHALEWLSLAIERKDGGLLAGFIPTRDEFDFLHNDPRYKALMTRMGVKPSS